MTGPSRPSMLLGSLVGAAIGSLSLWRGHPLLGSTILSFAALSALAAALLPRQHFERLSAALATLGQWAGTLVAVLTLTPLYLLVIVPLRFVPRGGRVRLAKRPDASLQTYWLERPQGFSDMKRPFG